MASPPRHPAVRRAPNVLRTPPRQWFVDYLPVTGENQVELLVDGKRYGESLMGALGAATRQVLLTGLHFQPTWRLVRGRGGPVDRDDPNTLLNVLRTLAIGGVEIYLLVNQFWPNEWTTSNPIRKAIKKAGHIDWYLPETAELFTGLAQYDNVHCRTDVHQGIIMSTHHQKTVVIDERVCFVGGIDLTLVDGDRWDDDAHRVPDAPPARDADPYGPADLRRYSLPEHFWHDVQCKVEGPAVQFVLDNFHARWNHGVLYRDVRDRIVTKHKYQRRGRMRVRVPYSQRIIEGVADEDPTPFSRIGLEPQVYQDRMRNTSSIHTRQDEDQSPAIVGRCGLDSVRSLSGTKIQVVRSMPAGRFTSGQQRPEWNLSGERWERSAKDSYIIGIRAARDYIYLENQWISDEHIWAELRASMRRNRDNPRFRIVIVLPRRPLSAAGYGTDQDVDLRPHVDRVMGECASADQFGMYCVQAPLPPTRRANVALSAEDIEEFGDDTAQIYIHSKVMIVDDTWGLIGSANAGGISLLGMTDLSRIFTTGRGSAPDSELSVVIHDPAFGKQFRETLWKEHLQVGGLPGSPHAAADLFRQKAHDPRHRLQPAVLFHQALRRGGDAARRVPVHVMQAVRDNTRIIPATDGPARLLGGPPPAFSLATFSPGPAFTQVYRWVLEDERGGRWELRGVQTDRVTHHYGPESSVYIPSRTAEALRAQTGMQGRAKILCRVLVLPRGVAPRNSSSDDQNYGALVELPITLQRQ